MPALIQLHDDITPLMHVPWLHAGPRKVAEQPIFGPKLELFTVLAGPVLPGPGADGEIRKYNVKNNFESKGYETVIPADNTTAPLFTFFAQSDPATFAYKCRKELP